MMILPAHFVRHGSCEFDPERLTERGRGEAERAAQRLASLGLGTRALLLSSTAHRAMDTAQIIAAKLGIERVLPSGLIEEAGQDPELVKDLDRVLEASLSEHGATVSGGLIVIAHEPLMSYLDSPRGDREVSNGEVIAYTGGWNNLHYAPDIPETQSFEHMCASLLGR